MECARAASDGHEFYISKNGVLLCGDLPSKYVSHACDYSDRSALPLPRVARLDYTAEKETEGRLHDSAFRRCSQCAVAARATRRHFAPLVPLCRIRRRTARMGACFNILEAERAALCA